MKIVYAGNHYYNHDPKLGSSFEHLNLYDSLRRMKGIDLTYIPYDEAERIGIAGLNELILKTVTEKKPDLFFAVMPHEDLDPAMLMKIKSMTTSAGWFGDDHWGFHLKTTRWGPYMTWCITTYAKAIPEYKKRGIPVIETQLAANPALFHPTPEALAGHPRYEYDVTFVGAWYHHRGRVVDALRKEGIDVKTWGPGWPEGRIVDDEMTRIMQTSKINLDLNPPSLHFGLKPLVGLVIKKKKEGGFRWVGNTFHDNVRAWRGGRVPLIKSRTWNCLATRSFIITQMTDDLPEYYSIDKEIVSYQTVRELAEKTKYYLAHDAEREAITQAGYERTLRDHTYEKRFVAIFRAMGLPYP